MNVNMMKARAAGLAGELAYRARALRRSWMEIAERAGLEGGRVQEILRGYTAVDEQTWRRLILALDADPDELLGIYSEAIWTEPAVAAHR